MRKFLLLSLLGGLLLGVARRATADDTPRDVIARAVKAFGGENKLATLTAVQSKAKGTITSGDGIDFTQTISAQLPGQFKEVLALEVKGKPFTIVTVFNGEKGWISVNGETKDLDDKLLGEMKEVAHMMNVNRLVTLKDTKYELSPLGEVKVEGRAAVGVRVVSKGHRDLNLYFDKESGLIAKVERRALDVMSGQEVTEERVIRAYQDLNGRKTPKKVAVYRDGKKVMEAEVAEVKIVDKFDASEFAKP